MPQLPIPQNARYTKEQLERLLHQQAVPSASCPLIVPPPSAPGLWPRPSLGPQPLMSPSRAVHGSPQSPNPDFLLHVRDFVSTLSGYSEKETAILLFAAQHITGKDATDRCVCYASGIGAMLLNALGHGLEKYDDVNSIVTGAWVQHYLDSTVHVTDRDKLALRKALIRVSGISVPGQQGAADKTPADEAADIIAEVAAEHPDRQQRITPLKAHAKRYRQAGLLDINIALLNEVNRINDEIAADQERILAADQTRATRAASAAEARRVLQQKADERQEQLRWEHDYEALQRRQKSLRNFIARAQKDLDLLVAEQQQMQQQPQFNVHKAAQQKAKAIAARQAERKARKKRASQE